jgi:hypothetical protein
MPEKPGHRARNGQSLTDLQQHRCATTEEDRRLRSHIGIRREPTASLDNPIVWLNPWANLWHVVHQRDGSLWLTWIPDGYKTDWYRRTCTATHSSAKHVTPPPTAQPSVSQSTVVTALTDGASDEFELVDREVPFKGHLGTKDGHDVS